MSHSHSICSILIPHASFPFHVSHSHCICPILIPNVSFPFHMPLSHSMCLIHTAYVPFSFQMSPSHSMSHSHCIYPILIPNVSFHMPHSHSTCLVPTVYVSLSFPFHVFLCLHFPFLLCSFILILIPIPKFPIPIPTHFPKTGKFCDSSWSCRRLSSDSEIFCTAWDPRSDICHAFNSGSSLELSIKYCWNSSSFSERSGCRDLIHRVKGQNWEV